MKKTRIVSCILMLCVITLTLLSCNNKDTLEVNSKNFESLEAKEVDVQWLKNGLVAGDVENAYNGPVFLLNERDGVIYLEEWEEESFSHSARTNHRYLIGADRGEWGGWVSLYITELNEDKTNDVAREIRLIDDTCLGFLHDKIWHKCEECSRWHDDPDVVYIFTGSLMLDEGMIYRFSNIGYEDYECKPFVELDSNPNAFMMDERNIVVATNSKGLLTIDPDGNVTELFNADYWSQLSPTSIVKVDNAYYIGAFSGILKYNIDTDDAVWYPYYDIEEE
jgi:hypothetical protein